MSRTIPEGLDAVMTDEDVRLERLAEEHRGELKSACAEDGAIWSIYSVSYDPDHFDASFEALRGRPDNRAFAVFQGDLMVGMSAYLGIDMSRDVLEIGNTYYVPSVRGTGLNRVVKRLMLGRAFGCGFRRVEFRVDARNARSQAALAKIGAVREGRLRADRITWTGYVRDTILFSILADEWAS